MLQHERQPAEQFLKSGVGGGGGGLKNAVRTQSCPKVGGSCWEASRAV